jgi:hypothetical protein
MYYVHELSKAGDGLILKTKVKRLQDFRVTEGVEYLVEKTLKPQDCFVYEVPVYLGKNGKLKKTTEVYL